jgi:MFS family permease
MLSRRRVGPKDSGMTRIDALARPGLPKAFRRLWWATGIDNLGTGAFTAAVPLLTVTITHDPRLVSLVATAAYLPWLLLALPAGALADRHDRATLMWRAQAVQAALASTTAVLAACGGIGVPGLVVTAFGLGAGDVVFGTAAQAILPDLVAKPLLPLANGSLLFGVAAALPFGLDAVSFALSAVLVATLPRRARSAAPARAAVREGLAWLMRHRLLRTLAILLGVNTFCGQLAYATLVLLATQVVHLDARGYGLLLAGAALGSVLGGLVNARILARIGTLPALLTALTANVGAFAGIGLSPGAVLLGVFLAVNGFVTTLWNVATVGLRQQLVPPALLGRVSSAYRLLGWGLIPVGTLTGGLVAHALGLRAPYLVAGAVRGIALVAALPVLVRALVQPPE